MRRLALAPAAASGMVAATIVLASCASGGGGPATAPTASPVKERIAFDRMHGATDYEGSYLGAIIANADGTGQQPLHLPKGWSGPVSPVWSPDGRKLVVSVRGKSPGYGEADSHPAGNVRWSPDGTEILFESQQHQLRLVHPDGSAQTEINLPPGSPDSPAWSPDGRWIIFSLALPQSAGVAHVYRAWPDGTHLATVTNTPDSDFRVSWGRPPGR